MEFRKLISFGRKRPETGYSLPFSVQKVRMKRNVNPVGHYLIFIIESFLLDQ